MTSDATGCAVVGLDRAGLAGRTRCVLQHGGGGKPDVLLVDSSWGDVVVKDFAPRSRLVRDWIGPWLVARELRAYRRLEGIAAVPRALGRLDRRALVLEYRPGTSLSRSLRGRLPEAFLAELEASIEAMHRRGVVHLDLRHRSNVLAGRDGRPVLIDFASALQLDPRGRLARRVLGCLARFDRRALEKWRVRLEPLSPDQASDQRPDSPESGGAGDSGASVGSGSSAGSRGASRPT